jgi:VIT1/CCC1 family predicted Fe2+/Mn2+ transporter
VIDAIRTINSQYGIYIHEDVIIAVPPDAVPTVEVYLQENSSGGSGFVNEISEGVSLIAGGFFGLLPIGVLSSALQTLGLYEPAAKLYHKVSTSVQ